MLTFPSAPPPHQPPPPPRAAPAANFWRATKVNRLLRTLKLNTPLFLKSPKSSALPGITSFPSHSPFSLSEIFILTSVNNTSFPHAQWTLVLTLHLTNPCAKRKVLSLTKPKGKIYKTKSLGHYITEIIWCKGLKNMMRLEKNRPKSNIFSLIIFFKCGLVLSLKSIISSIDKWVDLNTHCCYLFQLAADCIKGCNEFKC